MLLRERLMAADRPLSCLAKRTRDLLLPSSVHDSAVDAKPCLNEHQELDFAALADMARQAGPDITDQAVGMADACRATGRILNAVRPLLQWPATTRLAVALQHLSAVERLLGTIYTQRHRCGARRPHLLKDLLASTELQTLLGADIMLCLTLLLGPPQTLNLRNLLWHGFVAADELDPAFVIVLGLLLPSLQSTRGFLSFVPSPPTYYPSSATKLTAQSPLAEFVCSADCGAILPLLEHTWALPPNLHEVARASLDFFHQGDMEASLSLSVILLEAMLRWLYVVIHDMPDRFKNAEPPEYFITLTEILAPLQPDAAKPNALVVELGQSGINMLFDLLVHVEGPRVRDKWCHGEVDVADRLVAAHVIAVVLCLCARYADPQAPSALCEQLNAHYAKYHSIFHPSSLCALEMSDVILALQNWSIRLQPQEPGPWVNYLQCSQTVSGVPVEWQSSVTTALGSLAFRRHGHSAETAAHVALQLRTSDHTVLLEPQMRCRVFHSCDGQLRCGPMVLADAVGTARWSINERFNLLRQCVCALGACINELQRTSRAQLAALPELGSRALKNLGVMTRTLPAMYCGLSLQAILLYDELGLCPAHPPPCISATASSVKQLKRRLKGLQNAHRYAQDHCWTDMDVLLRQMISDIGP